MLAMDIALDVEVVDLWDAEKKVSGAGEVFGRLGDQSWDGAERVKAVRNINHALLLVKGFASAGLRWRSAGTSATLPRTRITTTG